MGRPDVVIHGNGIVDFDNFKKSEIYNEALVPMGTSDILALPIALGQNAVWLALCRDKHRESFQKQEVEVGEYLARFLLQSAQTVSNIERLSKVGTAASDPNTLRFIVTRDLCILSQTSELPPTNWIDKLCSVNKSRFLRLGESNLRRTLLDYMSRKSSLVSLERETPFVAYSDDLSTRMEVHPHVNLEGRIVPGTRVSEFMITFTNLDRPLNREALMAIFGLTAKEVEICGQIFLTRERDQICHRMQISSNTLKWHLKNIFEKTATNSALQLMKILSQLST